ncbi:MAG TPA: GNAT family N-acetyltransferase [Candidatus Desulfovibrio intestinipullorum]|uniref:GNAT family N-acetyltransferase n=1 Tax=Candidatus Desulfovibrio intestinipullorum TaxID=2838536 RepID=A0A9D1TP76_9BACT|nr:GNAT family N-acetyltransferase [Candidatus Desulfovibrio intestinipullorum]
MQEQPLTPDSRGPGSHDPAILFRTSRLFLRPLLASDLESLYAFMQHRDNMSAWEHGFSRDEVRAWIAGQRERMARDGCSYWALHRSDSGALIGQAGLLTQNLQGHLQGQDLLEVAYILDKRFWHQGYATEAAAGCISYAFARLHAREVCATIRPDNTASLAVARRLGLQERGLTVKEYRGRSLPHLVLSLRREQWQKRSRGVS